MGKLVCPCSPADCTGKLPLAHATRASCPGYKRIPHHFLRRGVLSNTVKPVMPTLTADACRHRLDILLKAGRNYEFLSMAESYLDVCPDDEFIRLMAAREYLKLQLAAPAQDIIEAAPAGGAASEVEAIRATLRELPSGIVPWSRHAARFAANLDSLTARGMQTSLIHGAWARDQRDYQLFHDANRVAQVRRRRTDGRWQWVPLLGHHVALDEARPLPEGLDRHMPLPILFEGLALGGFFERVHRLTSQTFLGYSCALLVAEADPAMFALVLHLRDWSELLADPRVFLFIGPRGLDQLRDVYAAQPNLPFPGHAVRLGTSSPEREATATEAVRDAGERREREIHDSWNRLERQYAGRDVAYWARRFRAALDGHGPPLRILTAVSTHTTFLQHSIRDARRAWEALGHSCRVLTEGAPFEVLGPLTFHQAVREFDPDLFFVIDHLRAEFDRVIPTNLPILTWDQDQLPHVFTRANLQKTAPHDFLAGPSKPACVLAGCNPRQFLHAYIPTSPEQFGGAPLTGDESARYACDVSYVSHASQTAQDFHQEERAKYAAADARYLLDTLYDLMPAAMAEHRVPSGLACMSLVEEAARRCGIAVVDETLRNRLVRWYLWRLGDRMFRHEALEWVARWSRRTGRKFRIYGNGWDRHPSLAEFAAGPADNGRELLCIYRASAVNLQLMPAGFIHQRALDGLAAGGFFMTRRVPQDLRGKTLRQLVDRIHAQSITNQREMFESDDGTLRELLREYFGSPLDWILGSSREPRGVEGRRGGELDLFQLIQDNAELLCPDEVFPAFDAINFDSAGEFERKAESFLAQEPRRRAIALSMREAALRHFSYQTTMDRFLRAMAGYLAAARNPDSLCEPARRCYGAADAGD
jgi:hypothetical protein